MFLGQDIIWYQKNNRIHQYPREPTQIAWSISQFTTKKLSCESISHRISKSSVIQWSQCRNQRLYTYNHLVHTHMIWYTDIYSNKKNDSRESIVHNDIIFLIAVELFLLISIMAFFFLFFSGHVWANHMAWAVVYTQDWAVCMLLPKQAWVHLIVKIYHHQRIQLLHHNETKYPCPKQSMDTMHFQSYSYFIKNTTPMVTKIDHLW